MASENQISGSLPAKMASRMEEAGAARAGLRMETLFALAILAGAFMSLGAMFATAVTTGLTGAGMGVGLVGLLGGLAFCLGIIAIVVVGAELFMANNLVVMAFARGRLTLARLVRFWAIVFLGNLVGAILLAGVMFLSGQYSFFSGALGANALAIASDKCSLQPLQAVILGILCSTLVCLAMWLFSYARSFTGRIIAILFPIAAFVAAGFEHSIANSYIVPIGLLIKYLAPASFWTAIGTTAANFGKLTLADFLINNFIPVTIGNIIGGAGLVGLVYWSIYLRPQRVIPVRKEARVPLVLVVDDDPDFVEVTSTILDKEGYKISTANNGKEAWASMTQKKPDMVLLDVMMSTTLEGVDLARRMAADPTLRDVPIIMISSIDSSYHAGKLPDNIQLPIDAWLSKPVNPELLLRTVRRFLA